MLLRSGYFSEIVILSTSRHTLLPFLALLLSATGCSEEKSFALTLLTADTNTQCLEPATTNAVPPGTYQIRFTFMRRADASSVNTKQLRDYSVVCDRVIPTGADVDLLLDRTAGSVMTIRAEAFQNGRLAFSGQRENVDVNGAETQVLMRPAGKASCATSGGRLHAFHSATLLPNGQVLLVGGLAAEQGGGDILAGKTEAFALGGVELYDPNTGKFTTIQKPIGRRVFHKAVLLPSPAAGPYRVLLIGGITTSADAKEAVRIKIGGSENLNVLGLPFNVSPGEEAIAAGAEVLQITYDDAGKPTVTPTPAPTLPRGMFPALALDLAAGRALFAPGAASYAAAIEGKLVKVAGFAPATTPPTAQWLVLPASGQPSAAETVPMARLRAGHDLVRFTGGRMFVFGGQADGPATTLGESLALSSGGAAFANVTPGNQTAHTGWQVFVPFGQTDKAFSDGLGAGFALWVGGFNLGKGDTENYRVADKPSPTPIVNVIDGAGGTPTLVAGTAPSGFISAGYQAAVRLTDGSVLVTGGNDSSSERFRAVAQVVRFRLQGGTAVGESVPGIQGLAIARFGHRMTRLLDGSVLVTGGLTLDKDNKLRVVELAEVFNTRLGNAGDDYPLTRDAATESKRCSGFNEPAAQSSPMVIVTGPLARTGKRRLTRSVRLSSDMARVRIRLGGSPR